MKNATRWILGLSLACIAFAFLTLHTYRTFTQEQLVMRVYCAQVPDAQKPRFLLTVERFDGKQFSHKENYLMYGDQWIVEGTFLKWHDWLQVFGIKNMHELSRLSSRYERIDQQLQGPHSAYQLDKAIVPLWQWVATKDLSVPFVESVYGSAAFVWARPGTTWEVYASPTGYWIKPSASER